MAKRIEVEEAYSNFARRLKLSFFFHNKKSRTRDQKFRPKSNFNPPGLINPVLKLELDHLERSLGSLELKKTPDNLDREERTAIKTLKQNKDIIIKPADKGAAIVIMDKTDYVGEAERQLANQVHYKRLEEPVFPKSIPKINEIFESLANRRFIDAGQLSSLKCTT